MRPLRVLLGLFAATTLVTGASACGDEDSTNTDPTTTTGLTPQEVEDPGEGENVPGDPNTPDPGTDDAEGGNQDEPGAGSGGDQSNPY